MSRCKTNLERGLNKPLIAAKKEIVKRQSYNGLRKRCAHPRKQWSECGCAWYYDFAFQKTRHREVLGIFDSRSLAEQAFDELKLRVKKGLPPQEPPPVQLPAPLVDTIETYARKWLQFIPLTKKVSTVGFYRGHLDKHVIPALGSISLTSLTRSECKKFALTLRDKKLARATMVGILTTLSALLSAAVEDDDCPLQLNPAKKLIKLLRDPNESKSRRLGRDKFFERDESSALLAKAREHFPEWYPFVLCGLRTGMRMGELLGLQWGDIDWRKSFVHIQRAWVRSAWTTPKSGKDRTVDMSDQLRAELRLWRRKQTLEWFKRGLSRPNLVFSSTARTPHDHSKVRKIFIAILKNADLRHRNLHAMRHTFISQLLQNGESPAYVQKQVGHQSMDITINVYGHFMPGGNRAAVNRLDDRQRQDASTAQAV